MRILIFFLSCFMLHSGCKKDDEPELPGPTQTGARTFGCKVDGRPFVTSGDQDANWSKSGVVYFLYTDGSISVDARQANPREYIRFRFKFNNAPGTYYLNDLFQYKGFYTDLRSGSTAINGGNEYKTSDVNTGQINITHYDGDIIAGTFSFKAANDSGEIVHLTEGRFDIPR